jgi:hypothetical protein
VVGSLESAHPERIKGSGARRVHAVGRQAAFLLGRRAIRIALTPVTSAVSTVTTHAPA